MPIPLLVWPALGLIGAGVAAALKALQDDEPSVAVKAIAIIGPRGSGKSSLRHLLVDGHVPEVYTPTGLPIDEETETKLGDRDVVLTVHDVSGRNSSRSQWIDAVKGSDLVVFAASASDLLSEDGYEATRSSANFYAGLGHEGPVLMVLSHADQTALYAPPLHEDLRNHVRVKNTARLVDARGALTVANLLAESDQADVLEAIKRALQ